MPATDWICKILNFWRSGRSKGLNCTIVPNFVEIAQTAAEIWLFSDFQDGGRRHLGFAQFQIFDDRGGQEVWSASSFLIASKSVEPRPRYGDLSIFQDGGRRHLGFLKFEIFNGRDAQEGWTAPSYQISSKSLKPR